MSDFDYTHYYDQNYNQKYGQNYTQPLYHSTSRYTYSEPNTLHPNNHLNTHPNNHLNTHQNNPLTDPRIAAMNRTIDQTKVLMKNNIDLVIERGESLENLNQSAMELSYDATRFRNQSRKLKFKMICKYVAWVIFILLVIAGILYLIISSRN